MKIRSYRVDQRGCLFTPRLLRAAQSAASMILTISESDALARHLPALERLPTRRLVVHPSSSVHHAGRSLWHRPQFAAMAIVVLGVPSSNFEDGSGDISSASLVEPT